MESVLIQRVKSFNDFQDGSDSDTDRDSSTSMRRIDSIPDMDSEIERNKNISWVRGQSLIIFYVGVIAFVRIFLYFINVPTNMAWTVVNIAHCVISFPFMHWIKGVPFGGLESDQGIYDRFTFWEQLDTGAQFTKTKKVLTIIPIVLFLLAVTASEKTGLIFVLNSASFFVILIAKFPIMHRVRLFGVNS
mmetsp:Transcript_2944/g.10324  ORF Transcript_2944/g.10324 Transcript_2944/m.10324 type:complete len:190 (+) Transcript_2944:171-740(+)|eukprot:CAMPEP_0114625198 /NCGR_PEP_ID=MMETSP0168-20121206/11149_1 /TAXON_ID=95228 ORGANISM="Vannella sp., Strain DIVA3 517/6/12" /NCGR_SAMPLE_ID=MMETSP0168 /ASSEMBLY_ACC=CAM_ASM_000044 /LENGTH=189 /DNA_ID=CAMNT_0001836477 /DNA_START=153 /DNA_END=722 /DNA_ORIENTATION=-